jgi:hypothetical protein
MVAGSVEADAGCANGLVEQKSLSSRVLIVLLNKNSVASAMNSSARSKRTMCPASTSLYEARGMESANARVCGELKDAILSAPDHKHRPGDTLSLCAYVDLQIEFDLTRKAFPVHHGSASCNHLFDLGSA